MKGIVFALGLLIAVASGANAQGTGRELSSFSKLDEIFTLPSQHEKHYFEVLKILSDDEFAVIGINQSASLKEEWVKPFIIKGASNGLVDGKKISLTEKFVKVGEIKVKIPKYDLKTCVVIEQVGNKYSYQVKKEAAEKTIFAPEKIEDWSKGLVFQFKKPNGLDTFRVQRIVSSELVQISGVAQSEANAFSRKSFLLKIDTKKMKPNDTFNLDDTYRVLGPMKVRLKDPFNPNGYSSEEFKAIEKITPKKGDSPSAPIDSTNWEVGNRYKFPESADGKYFEVVKRIDDTHFVVVGMQEKKQQSLVPIGQAPKIFKSVWYTHFVVETSSSGYKAGSRMTMNVGTYKVTGVKNVNVDSIPNSTFYVIEKVKDTEVLKKE